MEVQRRTMAELCYSSGNGSDRSNGSSWSEMERDPLEELTYLVNGPFTTLLVLAGLVSISVALSVLLRARRRPLIYLYLIALELWNALLLTSAFLLYSLPNLIYGRHAINGPYAYSYLYSYVASNASLVGTVWTVIALTVDRYAALCHPLWHKTFVTRGAVLRLILAVAVFSLLFTIPRYFELEIAHCRLPAHPYSHIVFVRTSPMRSSSAYTIFYKIVAGLALYSFVPFVAILLLTIRIAVELRQSWLKRRTMSNTFKDRPTGDSASNTMLVAVSIKFLLSHTMPTFLDLAELMAGHTAFSSSFLASFFVTISSLLLVVNASTNLWIYLGWGKRFRREFWGLFEARPLPDPSTSNVGSQTFYHSRTGSVNHTYVPVHGSQSVRRPRRETASLKAPRTCIANIGEKEKEPLIHTHPAPNQIQTLKSQSDGCLATRTRTIESENPRRPLHKLKAKLSCQPAIAYGRQTHL